MFWPETRVAIDGLVDHLNPDGELVLVYMPPPTSDVPASAVATEYAAHFANAGLTAIHHSTMDFDPPAVATHGRRPSSKS
jgi:hypothetical protein